MQVEHQQKIEPPNPIYGNKLFIGYRPWQLLQQMVFPTNQSSGPIDGQHSCQEKEVFQSEALQICTQCSIYLLLVYTENRTEVTISNNSYFPY